jgi:putative transcriptional regulator
VITRKEGSFGFVINREFDHTLNELMNDMDQLRLPVYFGGPVQMDTIHFLHMYPDIISGSFEVINGIYWGGDFEAAVGIIKRWHHSTLIRSDFSLDILAGHKGQLNSEIKGEIMANSRGNPESWFFTRL